VGFSRAVSVMKFSFGFSRRGTTEQIRNRFERVIGAAQTYS
jgi:hypothetical protein